MNQNKKQEPTGPCFLYFFKPAQLRHPRQNNFFRAGKRALNFKLDRTPKSHFEYNFSVLPLTPKGERPNNQCFP